MLSSMAKEIVVTVDPAGRVLLPSEVLERLHVHPQEQLLLEMSDKGVWLKSTQSQNPLTESLASMNLPVSDWDTMKDEIMAGRLGLKK